MKDQSEDDLRKKLTSEQYHVLREKGTEWPGSGKLLYNNKEGEYACPVCNTGLFKSDSKYETKIPTLAGWPSFANVAAKGAVELKEDNSYGMRRTEITCKQCGSHLGHLFEDPSSPSGQHYCVNSAALNFKPKEKL